MNTGKNPRRGPRNVPKASPATSPDSRKSFFTGFSVGVFCVGFFLACAFLFSFLFLDFVENNVRTSGVIGALVLLVIGCIGLWIANGEARRRPDRVLLTVMFPTIGAGIVSAGLSTPYFAYDGHLKWNTEGEWPLPDIDFTRADDAELTWLAPAVAYLALCVMVIVLVLCYSHLYEKHSAVKE